MNTQRVSETESLDAIVNEFGRRIAQVIVAKTLSQLFSGGLMGGQLAIHGEVTNPSAILSGGVPTLPSGRRARRTSESIDRGVTRIVAALMGGKRMHVEELRTAAGISREDMLMPLKRALESGQIAKTGQKRATIYHLPGSAPGATAAPKEESNGKIAATTFAGKNVIRRKSKAK